MNVKKVILIYLFCVLKTVMVAQPTESVPAFKNKVLRGASLPKIFAHLDQSIYCLGDTIFFSAYLLDGVNHKLLEGDSEISVKLSGQNDELVEFKVLSENGRSTGYIPVPGEWQDGVYSLNLLVDVEPQIEFVRNIFIYSLEKRAEYQSRLQHTNLDILLEGEPLIVNRANRVNLYAKVPSTEGFSAPVFITNDLGDTIQSVLLESTGPTQLEFTPRMARKYYLISTKEHPLEISLPNAVPRGVVLNIDKSSDNNLEIGVWQNIQETPLTLLVYNAGEFIFESRFVAQMDVEHSFNVIMSSTNQKRASHIFLIDDEGNIMKRALFYEPPHDQSDKETVFSKVSKRSKVKFGYEKSLALSLASIPYENFLKTRK